MISNASILRHTLTGAAQVAVYEHPWRQSGALWVLLCGAYVAIFGIYWLGNLAHLVMDMRSLIEARWQPPSWLHPQARPFISCTALQQYVIMHVVHAHHHHGSCLTRAATFQTSLQAFITAKQVAPPLPRP